MQRRKTKEEMYALIELWQKSGLGQAEFSRQQKVNSKTFYRWLFKYRTEKRNKANDFVQIITKKPQQKNPKNKNLPILIRYPNGVEVEICPKTEITKLKILISL